MSCSSSGYLVSRSSRKEFPQPIVAYLRNVQQQVRVLFFLSLSAVLDGRSLLIGSTSRSNWKSIRDNVYPVPSNSYTTFLPRRTVMSKRVRRSHSRTLTLLRVLLVRRPHRSDLFPLITRDMEHFFRRYHGT